MREIFHTIEQYHMIEAGMRVIAGVSGGADSVCLLYVLTEYQKKVPFEISVVHVEHGIRGEESLGDAAFVEALCVTLGVPCRTVRAKVRQLARENGLSLEEAGRAERYRIFEEIRKAENAQRIAVAHNRSDQAETVIWNLARGSGLKGLGGIRPVRDDIIRPLLFTGREHIEKLLREAGLSWRTDQTNLEQDYTRNKVRLSLLPQMQRELNSRASEHIAQAAEKLQQVQAFVERMTEQAARECIRCTPDVAVFLPVFEKQDPLIRQELLRRAMDLAGGLKDVGSVHLEALTELARMDCGKSLDLPGRVRAVRENQVIRFIRNDEPIQKERDGAGSGMIQKDWSGVGSGMIQKDRSSAGGGTIQEDRSSAGSEAFRESWDGEVCDPHQKARNGNCSETVWGTGGQELVLPIPGECCLPDCGHVPGECWLPDCGYVPGECWLPGGSHMSGKRQLPGQEAISAEDDLFSEEDRCLEAGLCGQSGRRVRVELLENSPELMGEIQKEKKYTKWLSYDTIKGDILLRHRRTGDYLVVNAQGGRKKIKDYFIDLKIPREMRDQIWLLADGAHVLWVSGYRISEAAKVHKGTRKVIKIQMEDEIK